MSRALLAAVLVVLSTAALAQTRNQAAAAGAAGVQSRLSAQGYKDVHDLRRLPDGRWVGEATRNGVPVTVTSDPAGTTTAR
jgi:hypothetical protein